MKNFKKLVFTFVVIMFGAVCASSTISKAATYTERNGIVQRGDKLYLVYCNSLSCFDLKTKKNTVLATEIDWIEGAVYYNGCIYYNTTAEGNADGLKRYNIAKKKVENLCKTNKQLDDLRGWNYFVYKNRLYVLGDRGIVLMDKEGKKVEKLVVEDKNLCVNPTYMDGKFYMPYYDDSTYKTKYYTLNKNFKDKKIISASQYNKKRKAFLKSQGVYYTVSKDMSTVSRNGKKILTEKYAYFSIGGYNKNYVLLIDKGFYEATLYSSNGKLVKEIQHRPF